MHINIITTKTDLHENLFLNDVSFYWYHFQKAFHFKLNYLQICHDGSSFFLNSSTKAKDDHPN